MNKLEKAKRREAARVLLIQAHDMIDTAKDKMLEIDGSDDEARTLWKQVSVALNDLTTYNNQKAFEINMRQRDAKILTQDIKLHKQLTKLEKKAGIAVQKDRCHFCLGWIEPGQNHVCGYE